MTTRAERRELNRRAHAIRRSIIAEEWAAARARGERATYRDVAPDLEAMTSAELVAAFGGDDDAPAVAAVAVAPAPVARKRVAPAHIQRLSEEYRLARAAWEDGLAAALAGARPDGKPARGEDPRYTDEERDYRAAHPAPVWKDFLKATRRTDVAA